MFAFDKSQQGLYYQIQMFIKCKCGNAIWIEQRHNPTKLIIVHCAVCQRFMTHDQFDQGLKDYSQSFKAL